MAPCTKNAVRRDTDVFIFSFLRSFILSQDLATDYALWAWNIEYSFSLENAIHFSCFYPQITGL
jgi:hypothetical protein